MNILWFGHKMEYHPTVHMSIPQLHLPTRTKATKMLSKKKKKSSHKRMCAIWFHLNKFQKHSKLNNILFLIHTYVINYKGKKETINLKFSLEMGKEFGRNAQEVSKLLQWKFDNILNKIISAICKNNFLTLMHSRYIFILFFYIFYMFICVFFQMNLKSNNYLKFTVLASAAHILKLERYRED